MPQGGKHKPPARLVVMIVRARSVSFELTEGVEQKIAALRAEYEAVGILFYKGVSRLFYDRLCGEIMRYIRCHEDSITEISRA